MRKQLSTSPRQDEPDEEEGSPLLSIVAEEGQGPSKRSTLLSVCPYILGRGACAAAQAVVRIHEGECKIGYKLGNSVHAHSKHMLVKVLVEHCLKPANGMLGVS
jgi:hypothetical protein